MQEIVMGVKDKVIEWRRDLHQIPEIGNELPKTAAYVIKQLEEMGIEYKKGIGIEDAIVATIKGTKAGENKTLALRADMDALPIEEKTGLPFASTNGNMHACGHDAHTAMLLGTIKVLNSMKDQFSGTIKFMFQPGEELGIGSKPMVEAGVMDGVDRVIGLHVGNLSPDGKKGIAYFKKGSMMACFDRWTMKITGLGAHGASPHAGIDPVVIQAHIVSALQEIISRELNPVDFGVITTGIVKAGTAYNIIPGSAYLEGTARAVTAETREYIKRRIGEIGDSIAKSFRGSIEYEYILGAPPVVNNDTVVEETFNSAVKALGAENVKYMDLPVMAGEDFAFYLGKAPGTFIFLSNPMPIDGVTYAHHNAKFAIDENYFTSGIAIFVQSALDYLK